MPEMFSRSLSEVNRNKNDDLLTPMYTAQQYFSAKILKCPKQKHYTDAILQYVEVIMATRLFSSRFYCQMSHFDTWAATQRTTQKNSLGKDEYILQVRNQLFHRMKVTSSVLILIQLYVCWCLFQRKRMFNEVKSRRGIFFNFHFQILKKSLTSLSFGQLFFYIYDSQ